MEPWTRVANGIRLRIHAQPNARRTEIVGLHGDALKIKIQAVPEDGKANAELISFLARLLDLPRKTVRIVSGESSRTKTIEIESKETEKLIAKLTNTCQPHKT